VFSGIILTLSLYWIHSVTCNYMYIYLILVICKSVHFPAMCRHESVQEISRFLNFFLVWGNGNTLYIRLTPIIRCFLRDFRILLSCLNVLLCCDCEFVFICKGFVTDELSFQNKKVKLQCLLNTKLTMTGSTNILLTLVLAFNTLSFFLLHFFLNPFICFITIFV
jgi:hypothetical protein